jgi:rare lipoprotein A (peptidoglycan hydrolase)
MTLIPILLALTITPKIVSPIPENYHPVNPTVYSKVTLKGTASYYSESGCLGCSKTLTMANGERLDDSKLTIAMTPKTVKKYKLLNKVVTIKNVKSNAVTEAKVTDTGGFEKYSRIADLSVAVKRSIRCSDLCEVEISFK